MKDYSRVNMVEEESQRVDSPEEGLPTTSARSFTRPHGVQSVYPLDPLVLEGIHRYVIAKITNRSLFNGEALENLKTALFAVSIRDLSVNAASREFNICQTTLNEYARNMRRQLDSLLPPQFGNYESMMDDESVNTEEEESLIIEQAEEDKENTAINKAIEMALGCSKEMGAQAEVMREALKDSLVRDIPVDEIIDDYGFTDQSSISDLINKTRVFLKEICRKHGKDLLSTVAKPSSISVSKPRGQLDSRTIQMIRDCIGSIYQRSIHRIDIERRRAALYAICTGELTVAAASKKFNISSKSLRENVQKARLKLGSILPLETKASNSPCTGNGESVTIDGNPKSEVRSLPFALYRRPEKRDGMQNTFKKSDIRYGITGFKHDPIAQIATIDCAHQSNACVYGRLDYSNAKPFLGTTDELREKLLTIFQIFNGKVETRVDAIMYCLNGRSMNEASKIHKIDNCALCYSMKTAKIFVDFANSPCTNEFQCSNAINTISKGSLDSGRIEPPQLLPIPPEILTIEDWEIKKEEKEEG